MREIKKQLLSIQNLRVKNSVIKDSVCVFKMLEEQDSLRASL